MRIYTPVRSKESSIPLMTAYVGCGFPSPADDYIEAPLDLNHLLIRNVPSTFFVWAHGESMDGEAGTILDGDLLVVDKAKAAKNGDIVVACLDGRFTVKRLYHSRDQIWLLPDNKRYPEIQVKEGDEFIIWGVVTARITQFK